jgi:hypothetical protein
MRSFGYVLLTVVIFTSVVPSDADAGHFYSWDPYWCCGLSIWNVIRIPVYKSDLILRRLLLRGIYDPLMHPDYLRQRAREHLMLPYVYRQNDRWLKAQSIYSLPKIAVAYPPRWGW